jgi:hypothetical protein
MSQRVLIALGIFGAAAVLLTVVNVAFARRNPGWDSLRRMLRENLARHPELTDVRIGVALDAAWDRVHRGWGAVRFFWAQQVAFFVGMSAYTLASDSDPDPSSPFKIAAAIALIGGTLLVSGLAGRARRRAVAQAFEDVLADVNGGPNREARA